MKIQNMNVASCDFLGGSTAQDLAIVRRMHTYAHEDSDEYILFLGTGPDSHQAELDALKHNGASPEMLAVFKQAFDAGYEYLCFF